MAPLKLYALQCGGDMMDMALFDPFDANAGTKVYNPYFMYVVTHPQGNVLFDSGAHPDLGTNPQSRLGEAAADFDMRRSREDHVERCLATIGMTPRDIDLVIQSHLHFDHAGGLAWLTHAPVLVQREELAFARKPSVYQELIYVQADFGMDLTWREVDGDHDVFGDGRVTVISTPGHTRGHQSLLVRLEGETVFLLADAAYLIHKMLSRSRPGILWSPDAIVASWDRIEELERSEHALLITTHALDYETSVKMAPDGWYE